MKHVRAWLGVFAVLAASSLAACTGEIEDETVAFPSPTVELSSTADRTQVRPGQRFPITIFVSDDVLLVEPGDVPPVELAADAAYLVLTLDDESSTPLLATAQTEVAVTIPPSTTEGLHTILCRVYTHQGMPTASTASMEIQVVIDVASAPDDTFMDTSFPFPAPAPPPEPI
jgi:hypothetical protein